MPQTPAIIPSARGPAPVQTITEGETLMRHLTDVMEQLLRVLDEETALVRAGRLSEVGRLEAGKADQSRHFFPRPACAPPSDGRRNAG